MSEGSDSELLAPVSFLVLMKRLSPKLISISW